MTQHKSEVKATPDLRKQYLALSNDDQVGINTFFNLHNAATFVFDKLSEKGKKYTEMCIKLSQESDYIEKHPEEFQEK